MRAVIFGATGMIGQGVLRECLRESLVTRVLAVGRRPVGILHPKLEELVRSDFFDWSDAEDVLSGYDACFFTRGVCRDERGRVHADDVRPDPCRGRRARATQPGNDVRLRVRGGNGLR